MYKSAGTKQGNRVADAIVEGVSISLLQTLKCVTLKMLACDMIIKYELLIGDIPDDPASFCPLIGLLKILWDHVLSYITQQIRKNDCKVPFPVDHFQLCDVTFYS